MEAATGPEVVLEHTLTGERANQAEQLQHTSCSEREREREREKLQQCTTVLFTQEVLENDVQCFIASYLFSGGLTGEED